MKEQLERDTDVDRHRDNNKHFSHVRVVLHAHAAGAPKQTDTGWRKRQRERHASCLSHTHHWSTHEKRFSDEAKVRELSLPHTPLGHPSEETFDEKSDRERGARAVSHIHTARAPTRRERQDLDETEAHALSLTRTPLGHPREETLYLYLSHTHRWGTHEEKSRRNRGTRAVSPTHATWAPTRRETMWR